MAEENTASEDAPTVVGEGAIDTFYYAYCDTEKKRIGGATNQHIVAQNTANYHRDNTGHTTRVEDDKSDPQSLLDSIVHGNGADYLSWAMVDGPSVRLYNRHPSKSMDIELRWVNYVAGKMTTNNTMFPGDQTIIQKPADGYLGIDRIWTTLK